MENKKIVTGIDIGTTKVVAVIAAITYDYDSATANEAYKWPVKDMQILGIGEHPSHGLKKGIVVDIEETTKSLENAIRIAEEKAECEVTDVYVGITGDHINGMNYRGKISLNNKNEINGVGTEITKDDVYKALEASEAINVSPGMRILHTLSQSYEVDDRKGILNPVGLSGNTLAVNVHLVTSLINVEKDIETCFSRLGVEIKEFVLEPLASSCSVLDDNEKELGVALIDIGGGTTDILVYYDGGVQHSSAIPLAGKNLTVDISHRFKTTLEQAQELKHNHGIAKSALANQEKIKVKGVRGRETIEISQAMLSEVIEPRMVEIFNLSLDEIRKSNVMNKLNFGVVITGGGSQLKNTTDLAQEIFNMPVKIGYPELKDSEVSKVTNNPRYATAIGIIEYASTQKLKGNRNLRKTSFLELIKSFFKRITNWY
tara:strand:- start:1143 stop:2432 length:1290 start_codon:yes stop_codon:yes gene_type:complete